MRTTTRERAIAAALLLSILGSVGFMYGFWRQASTQWLGFALACVFAGFAIAALGWARWILPREEVVDLRDTYPDATEERGAQVEAWEHGLAEVTRKKWLMRMLYAAFGVFGLAALFPVGALGPEPDDTLFHTRWKRGDRMQRDDGTLVRADDLNVNAIETVFPEGSVGDYRSMAVIIRLPNGVARDAVDGFVVYSKACTHAGCPVALYRSADHLLLCPCHQSLFDAADGAKVIDGPADHPLPQLPIQIGSDGYVRALGDFPDPIGPGFWEHS
jgi:ubiquinol-cytochrome c reductase iron-sulfur subunit